MNILHELRWLAGSILVLAALTGCKPGMVEEQQRQFTFAADGETVTEEELGGDAGSGSVHADFNADGLEDYAIIEDGNGREVTIFIRKAIPDDPDSDPIYYRAGSIRRTLEGNIIGLMSRKGPRYTDLVVLIAREGEPNQMIHYRNDGQSFTEVQ